MSMHKGICGQCDGGGSIKPTYTNDVTLGDYITRKQQAAAFDEVKMTFDEVMKSWFPEGFENFEGNLNEKHLKAMWIAALTKGKL